MSLDARRVRPTLALTLTVATDPDPSQPSPGECAIYDFEMEEKMKRLEEVVVAAKDAATAANNQALYP